MTEPIKEYLNIILSQRDWSWTLLGIVYLLLALTIRSWFVNPVAHHARKIDRKYYRKIKKAYLERSILGWIFFLIPFFTIIGFWNSQLVFPLTVRQAFIFLGAVGCYILSIIFHLMAFSIAVTTVFKKTLEEQKIL